MLDIAAADHKTTTVPDSVTARRSTAPLRELNLSASAMKKEYLTRELEVELSTAWLERGCEKSRNRLVYSHQRLASKMACKMKRNGSSVNDLMQEASLGLMRAADKFDPKAGNRFSTYAVWWIKSAIQEAVMRENSAVRLKSSSINRTAFFTLANIERRVEMKLRASGKSPTQQEINAESARMMGLDVERFEDIKNAMPCSSSLNAPVPGAQEGGLSSEFVDILPSDTPSPEQLVVKESSSAFAVNAIATAMAELNPREIRIIQSRTMSLEPLTLEVLSQEFGVTRERVRQLEVNAMGKLRRKLEAMGIRNLNFLADEA